MKTISTYAVLLITGAIVGFIPLGCASTSIKHLSGEEFIAQASQIGELNSFHWTSYIGSSSGRAYLEFGYPAPFGKGSRTTVYWTFLSELPDDIVSKLKVDNPPWKRWQPETNGKEKTMPPAAP